MFNVSSRERISTIHHPPSTIYKWPLSDLPRSTPYPSFSLSFTISTFGALFGTYPAAYKLNFLKPPNFFFWWVLVELWPCQKGSLFFGSPCRHIKRAVIHEVLLIFAHGIEVRKMEWVNSYISFPIGLSSRVTEPEPGAWRHQTAAVDTIYISPWRDIWFVTAGTLPTPATSQS